MELVHGATAVLTGMQLAPIVILQEELLTRYYLTQLGTESTQPMQHGIAGAAIEKYQVHSGLLISQSQSLHLQKPDLPLSSSVLNAVCAQAYNDHHHLPATSWAL